MPISWRLKLLLGIGTVAGLTLSLPAVSQAQVILHDPVSVQSAFMFIAPNDQPVAKTVSEIHFSLNPALLAPTNEVRLHITSETGGIHEHVPVSIARNQVTGVFEFPVNGVYDVELEIVGIGTTGSITLKHTVHVVRSLGAPVGTRSSNMAIMGLFVAISSVAALILLVFSHRKTIK